MNPKEEKKLLDQVDELHQALTGSGDKPGLFERVRKLEGMAKKIITTVGVMGTAMVGFLWDTLTRK